MANIRVLANRFLIKHSSSHFHLRTRLLQVALKGFRFAMFDALKHMFSFRLVLPAHCFIDIITIVSVRNTCFQIVFHGWLLDVEVLCGTLFANSNSINRELKGIWRTIVHLSAAFITL